MSSGSLGFRVGPVRSAAELQAVCRLRALAYGHHLPQAMAQWSMPDDLDHDPDTLIFLAADKATGEAVGTVRLNTNAHRPTAIETSATLPQAMRALPLAEVTRLCVRPGHRDPTIRLALMKASYLWCLAHQVQWMVIGARSEALVRQYRRLGFTDLHDDAMPVALPHAGNLPHRVLAFDVVSAERNWHALQHPFYQFMVRTFHREIQLFHRTEPELACA